MKTPIIIARHGFTAPAKKLAAVAILATVAIGANLAETRETRTEEVQVRTPQDAYKAVWDYCGVRFPFRTDLQEACQRGAYEMLPDAPEQEMKDA